MPDNDRLPHDTNAKAMVHWLGGIVFSLILSGILLFLAPQVRALQQLLQELETRGIDAVMRMDLALAPPNHLRTDGRGYVFLDIDGASCDSFEKSPRCFSRSPAAPGLAARVVAAALDAEPRIVIIDVALWDGDPGAPEPRLDFARLTAAMRAHPDVPVVSVAPFRPVGERRHGVIDRSLLPAGLRFANIRYAPAVLWQNAQEGDSVVRGYPASVSAREDNKQRVQTLQTVPYLAALYVGANHDPRILHALDCRYNVVTDVPLCTGNRGQFSSALSRSDIADRADKGERMTFSIPSIVPDSTGARPVISAQYQGSYDRYLTSAIMTKRDNLSLDPGLLHDKIVIVSTSAIMAFDHHSTPLGDMTGAEIVLNGIHAFLNNTFVEKFGIWSKIEHELEITLVTSIPWLAFWMFNVRAARLRPVSLLGRITVGIASAAAYLVTLAVAMVFAAFTTLSIRGGPVTSGLGLEFFTPIFALSLEGFADGARWIIDLIGEVVESLLLKLMRAGGVF